MSNVLLVSGNQVFLRKRLLHKLLASKDAAGWRVVSADAGERGAIVHAKSGDMFFDGDIVIVVVNSQKADVRLYREHIKSKSKVVLVLEHDGKVKGNTKFGKWAKELGPKWHQAFNASDQSWKQEEEAVAFAVKEAKGEHGLELSVPLAKAMVTRIGSDCGVLVFELRKIAALASLTDSKAVLPVHIREAKAELLEASVGPLLDALQAKNRKGVVRQMDLIYATSKSDPTIRVVRSIKYSALLWLKATTLDNLPPKAAAAELGINPWYFQNKVLPVARSWGKVRVIRLIRVLAASERAVFGGYQRPWVFFGASLMKVL